jgi:hypothetical protein
MSSVEADVFSGGGRTIARTGAQDGRRNAEPFVRAKEPRNATGLQNPWQSSRVQDGDADVLE